MQALLSWSANRGLRMQWLAGFAGIHVSGAFHSQPSCPAPTRPAPPLSGLVWPKSLPLETHPALRCKGETRKLL